MAAVKENAYRRILADLHNYGSNVIETDDLNAKAQCPAHDDNNPSLSIRQESGRARVKCWAGCEDTAVLAQLGRDVADLFDSPSGVAYKYPGDRLVIRKPGKKFHQSGNKEDTSLYRSDLIGDATTVYIVEGESDVDNMRVEGVAAVCSAGGAENPHKADWSALHGKDVIMVVDADDAGKVYVRKVFDQLDGKAASFKVVHAAEGKDATDHLMAGHSINAFIEVPIEEFIPKKVEVPSGSDLIGMVGAWWTRFIACDPEDLDLLALWTVHTHLAAECYTSPRLLLDSAMPGSGKTTVCEHLHRLGCNAIHLASVSSTALLVRILQDGIRTLLIDEVDRSLSPDKQGVGDLIAVLNSGYKVGATRPVLVPGGGGSWKHEEMPTFAPVVLAGNSPRLPDDTRSRCIRILLMPDLDHIIEDSDWEYFEDDAQQLHDIIAAWADSVRDNVSQAKVDLPDGCRGRSREKWRPLKRVAVAAGGDWPEKVDNLIIRDLAEEAADREDGLRTLPPAVVAMADLFEVWPAGRPFMATGELVPRLVQHNPEQWGGLHGISKGLTPKRLGRMISQVAKTHSTRVEHNGPRGYHLADLEPAWRGLGIGRNPR